MPLARRPRTDPSVGSDAADFVVLRAMRSLRATVPPRLRGSFTFRYVGALATVAVLATVSCLTVSRVVSSEGTAAAVVNVSGLQRMLSQRIALESEALTSSSSGDRAGIRSDLTADAAKMATDQRALLDGDRALGLPGHPSAAVLALFDGGTAASVDAYLADVHRLLASPDPTPSDPVLQSIQDRALGALLPELNQIVLTYQAQSEARVAQIKRQEETILAVTLLTLLVEALLVFRPMTRRIALETERLEAASDRFQAEAERHAFSLRLRDAFDLVDTEADLVETVVQAVAAAEVPGALDLLLDREGGALAAASTPGPHGCTVATSDGCPALRQGRSMHFPESDHLGTCAQLRRDAAGAGSGPVASTCVPVTFLGKGIGVLRAVTPPCPTVDERVRQSLEAIAGVAGTYIGTRRALNQSRSDAQSDPLTGLLNRRGLEQAVAALDATHRPYVLIAADLDHFKAVNDTHGHDVGDTVLVETARAMTAALRPGDVLARTGGEEFVIAVPLVGEGGAGDGLTAGVAVAERIRASIASAHERSAAPLCTASFGVAAPAGRDLASTLRLADVALYRAKDLGRDRVEVAGQLFDLPDDLGAVTRP